MSFYKPEGTIGTGMKGKVNVRSPDEAKEIHKIKRDEGLCANIDDRGLTQGIRIHPITVSWWV